jgi:hypothetical protein
MMSRFVALQEKEQHVYSGREQEIQKTEGGA